VTARRVPPSGAAPAGRRVAFTFDGRALKGIEGEPLAVSLLAAGQPILSRSFRFHRPRGLMCSTGQCGWCECEVDGVPSVRSCRVPVREGLVARGEHAWPSVEHDALSLVGLFSRWIPPTFYHHRFLRPRRLRKRYLEVLRWFGGRGRLHVGPPERGAAVVARPLRRVPTDVAVVGGGPAGLLAATAAADEGVRVVLIEAERAIGTGWRSERTADLEAAARAAGVELLPGVTAAGWYDGVVAAIGSDVHLEIAARAVVAATGSYDRVPLVPGADRPGVLAARTAIDLVERHGVLPGDRALLVGSGRELDAAGAVLARAGIAEIHGPVATAALVRIHGTSGVAGADLRIDGRRQHIGIDLVVFGDRSPNLDLVLAAGASVERRGDAVEPTLDGNGRTTVPTMFMAGSAAGRAIVDAASADAARATGRAAAHVATGRRVRTASRAAVGATLPVELPRVPASIARSAMVCFCEDVRAWEIRAELESGYHEPELVKRRTGALTGPCQGKQCLQAFAYLVVPAGDGAVDMPTGRPPLGPIRLGDLVAGPLDAAETDA
jgi:sarcosine oxidase subunit alpha